MININQTSEQTKILIPRSNINGDIEKNNYVTEDELQEQLKNINIPYLVVDHIRFENGDWGYGIVSGDYNGVLQAIKENKPQIIYIPYENPRTYLLPHSFQYNSIQDGIYVSTNIHNAVDMNFHYYVYLIKENSVEQTVRETRYVQEKLVSGENIKTINGNDILGEGDITIESGTNIPYLVIDNLSILDGDWQKVYDAISNNQPYLIYKKRPSDGWLFTDDGAKVKDNYIEVIFCIETYSYDDNTVNLYYTSADIYTDRVEGRRDEIIDIATQFKTINGNEITGTGDIIIEGGNGNIVELTQEEYNSIIPDSDTLYLISDSNIYTSIKTINGESIIGEGNINIGGGDFSNYYTKSEIDNMVGDIETILDNIIGNN